MSKAPAFQLYAADFYMDTASWTIEEVGIYTRLLFYQWVNGSLPNDEKRLARIAGTNTKTFNKWFSVIKSKFPARDHETLINLRLEESRQKQDEYYNARKSGGIITARKRWGEKKEDSSANSSANSLGVALQSSSSSSTSKPIKEIKEPKGSLSESKKIDSDGNGKYPPCPQQEIINTYHKTLPELPRVKQWPENLQVILRTRWKEDPVRQNLAWWEQFFRYVQESDFLMGRTKEAFVADLEWLVRPKNFTKIANGRYHGRGNLSAKPQPGIAAWLAERSEHDQTG